MKEFEVLGKAMATKCEPPAFREEMILLDGKRVVIRPIRSEDKPALLEFHARLGDETRFLRYHYTKGQLTDLELKDFCDVDYSTTLALVAEEEFGGNKIFGVGRYSCLPVSGTAEVAFVVQDNEQLKGIGTQLLKHLARIASKKDIRFFVAEVLRVNGRMLSIFRKADPGMKQVNDDGSTCTVTVSVAEAMCEPEKIAQSSLKTHK